MTDAVVAVWFGGGLAFVAWFAPALSPRQAAALVVAWPLLVGFFVAWTLFGGVIEQAAE